MSCSGSQVWCGDGYTWHVALLGHVLSAGTRWQGKSELLCGLLLAAGNTAIITTFRLEMGGDRQVSYSYSCTAAYYMGPTPAILRPSSFLSEMIAKTVMLTS